MKLTTDSNANPIPVMRPGRTHTVSLSTSSASAVALSNDDAVYRVISTAATYVAIDGVATTGDMLLPANTIEYVRVEKADRILGSELITNPGGPFSATTGWTVGADATVTNTGDDLVIECVTSPFAVTSNLTVSNEGYHEITYTGLASSEGAAISLLSGSATVATLAEGSATIRVYLPDGAIKLSSTGTAGDTFQFTSFSIKAVKDVAGILASGTGTAYVTEML